MTRTTRCLLFAITVSAWGCPGDFGGDDNNNPYVPPASNVSGIWTITGRGDRTSCAEEALEGAFSLDSMIQLRVRQTPNTQGAVLSLATPITPGGGVSFAFQGTVNGAAVSFTTIETGSNNSYTLAFNYTGEAMNGMIQGSFSGTGPSNCRSSGTFEVVVTGQPIVDDGYRPIGDPLPSADPVAVGDESPIIAGDSSGDQIGLSCGCKTSGVGVPVLWALVLVGLGRRRRG